MSNKKGIEKHCEYLGSKIRKKQQKIDELRQRIDKAIELIETKMYVMTFGEMRNLATKEDYELLLSILKGEDKE